MDRQAGQNGPTAADLDTSDTVPDTPDTPDTPPAAADAAGAAGAPETPTTWSVEQVAAIEEAARVRTEELVEARLAERLAEKFAEIQRTLLDKRKERAQKDGHGSGPLPYGYRHAIVVDEEHAKGVRRIFEWSRAGLDDDQIAQQLAAAGIHPSNKRGIWTALSVRRVLSHEHLYRTGERVWDGIQAREKWPTILDA